MPTVSNQSLHTPPCDASSASALVPTDFLPDDASENLSSGGGTKQPLGLSEPSVAGPRREIWGVPFDPVTLPQSVTRIGELIRRGIPSYVITANLNYAMLNHRRGEMNRVTQDASLVLADGQPIVWRSKFGGEPLPQRVTGSELIFKLAQRASVEGWRIYFLGGAPDVAKRCAQTLQELYPGLEIAGCESPPYRDLTPAEQAQQDARIRDSGTDVLLVAFGQPKGELWIHQNYQRLGVPVSIQLGASFDFVAGTAKRAPVLWQKAGMEWAYRMLSDPRRLVPRYAANAAFLAGALLGDGKDVLTSWPGQANSPDWTTPAPEEADQRSC